MNVELFSAESKSLGTSIAFTFNWICAFVITKFEPDLVRKRRFISPHTYPSGFIGITSAYGPLTQPTAFRSPYTVLQP